jgi:hypothetical protein
MLRAYSPETKEKHSQPQKIALLKNPKCSSVLPVSASIRQGPRRQGSSYLCAYKALFWSYYCHFCAFLWLLKLCVLSDLCG